MRNLYLRALVFGLVVGLASAPAVAPATVTTVGKTAAVIRIIDAAGLGTAGFFNFVGIGTGSGGTCTGDAAGDTALQTEVGTRQQDTDATAGAAGVSSLQVTFAAGNGTGTICEVGTFDAVSSGTLLQRKTFTGVAKGAGDALQVTITLTVS